MSLIDDNPVIKDAEKEAQIECTKCHKKDNSVSKQLNLCKDCFELDLNDVCNKIKKQIEEINEQIKLVDAKLKYIEAFLTSQNAANNIVSKNQAKIDQIISVSMLKKLEIDLQANKDALEINKETANYLKKLNNW